MELGLKGKVALVTGAGSQIGFGKAIALALAKEGCDIVVNDINLEDAQKTAAAVEKLGRRSLAIRADVTSGAAWDDMVKEILGKFGRIDILVNNAGGCTPPRPFLEMTDKDWDFDIDVNLRSTRNGTRAVLPHMIKQKSGKIVNVTSGAGIHGGMFTSGYAAAKAGIIGFSMGVAKEAAPHGININCVSPGVANTGFAKNAPPGLIENFPRTLPIGRLTTTRDVANAVVFLVSDAASDIVGQVLVVSGGVSP
ncbi:MAG TPA: SDR family NAD(P)-dependent oxidoreductase [Dehalococcoidales bacterium]|nr:SDR family NAD(P)-dependent oxidoreductase [Dehalococcoidales bacterium]